MNIPDHISESLETMFWVKMLNLILKFSDADADLGSGHLFDPGSGIRDRHTGTATLLTEIRVFEQVNNHFGRTLGSIGYGN
jgi:hypothetical protein